ncbi:hypothetical protein [Salinimicrobium sediminilitoris]|uniref:hypothetical protein n=1 Tax=Salinimicrobium sediminilitoris TaxID=2876715 RepID=UPI001E629A6C|nr:hypothetical protein [Salinimicrobium sediminilitoris]MCC8360586.1 hypothetical protein [Salinimicrobium sediminilitoris]
MNTENLISRLKGANHKKIEAISLKREIRQLPPQERTIILNRLREEKRKSDNSDFNDAVDDIINEFSPDK